MKKHPENVPGKYYIDCSECCDFGLCAAEAPRNIRQSKHNYAAGNFFVFKQPETPEEVQQCEMAMTICPVAVIHADGDLAPD